MNVRPKAPDEPPPGWRDLLLGALVLIGFAIVISIGLWALGDMEMKAIYALRAWWRP